jgi:hypothetical protein
MNEVLTGELLAELKRSVPELEMLYRRKKVMGEDYSSAVKAVARRCGVPAGALAKFVAARATDNGDKVLADAVSTADLFQLVE